MKVLIGYSTCPLTRLAFEERGHEAYTCDLLPARPDDPTPEMHIEGDIWTVLGDTWREWDLGIFHPMCTYLTGSAAWAFKDPDYERYPDVGYHQRPSEATLVGQARRDARQDAVENFKRLMGVPFPVCCENPARGFLSPLYRPADQIIHPYQFGDDASKATGLWLKDLAPLRIDPALRLAGRIVGGKERWANQTDTGQNKLGPGKDRWLERSKTYPGIAKAFAENWG